MAMRFKPKNDHTAKRTLAKPTTIYDAHPYMSHHSFYASDRLRKKRAKRQQQELRQGERGNMGKHYQTYAAATSQSMEDREFSSDGVV